MAIENIESESGHLLDYWRVILSRKEIIMAVFFLVVATGVMVAVSLPKVYLSSVVIQVKEDTPDVAVFNRQVTRYYDPYYLQTQFEIIQSTPVVEEVVRRLTLHRQMAKACGFETLSEEKAVERTARMLSGGMNVKQFRDTNLIEIRIQLSEPRGQAHIVAAEVADMVANVYREQTMQRSRENTERALKALQEQLEEQKKRVRAAEDKVEQIRVKYRISTLGSSENTDNSLPKMSLANLEANRIRLRLELEDKKSRFEKLRSLKPDELVAAAPFIVGDAALAALVAEKRRAEVELNQKLAASLGPKHPDVQRVQGVIDELAAKIGDALRGLMSGVQADYEAAQARYAAVEQELEALKATEIVAFGSAYREFEKAQEELAYAKRITESLEVRYIQERIELRIPRTTVEIIQPAKPSDITGPIEPNILLYVMASIMMGLVAGVGLAYFIEYLDTSLKTVEDIERFMGVQVIGVIPQKVKPLIDRTADQTYAEAYRILRTHIRSGQRTTKPKTLCVTSGSVGEGKSLTVFNLAYVCAQLGDKVLLVDSDLHRPRQHKILGVSNQQGLADVLRGDKQVPEVVVSTTVKNLDFLPSGRGGSNVHGLLEATRIRSFVDSVRDRYDLVLLDSPPMIGVSDSSLLVQAVDNVIFVIQHRKYPRIVARRAKDLVTNMGGRLIGIVLNSINIAKDYSYYYYQHQTYTSKPAPGGS